MLWQFRIKRQLGAMLLAVTAFAAANGARGAGAVEMQVEHLLVQSIEEYNQAMEAGDPSDWMRYFTDAVQRRSPGSVQNGKKEFAEYYRWEFQTFQAKYVPQKILVSGRGAAAVFIWDAVHRASGESVKVEMVGVYEMGPSGRIEKVAFYFDPAAQNKMSGGR